MGIYRGMRRVGIYNMGRRVELYIRGRDIIHRLGELVTPCTVYSVQFTV